MNRQARQKDALEGQTDLINLRSTSGHNVGQIPEGHDRKRTVKQDNMPVKKPREYAKVFKEIINNTQRFFMAYHIADCIYPSGV